jgi:hypothetical protein
MKFYRVYQLLRPYAPFTVAYIGIDSSNTRPRQHLNAAKKNAHPNPILMSIFNKAFSLGYNNLDVRILASNLTRDEACQMEKQQIALLGRIDNKTGSLSNLTNGGDGSDGWVMSEITKRKIAEKARGRPKSEQTKLLISINGKGKTRSNFTKEKIRKYNLGKKRTLEARQAMSDAAKKRPKPTPESNEKRRQTLLARFARQKNELRLN